MGIIKLAPGEVPCSVNPQNLSAVRSDFYCLLGDNRNLGKAIRMISSVEV
ncbi:hypothetical protein M5E87_16240 [Flavonifractor plautii]|nr:hypothetical protein M5E87_16240 [Flavonifractor plautii]